MKKNKYLIFLLIFLSFQNYLQAQKKYKKLVWSDEFNYKGLPDSTKWGYDVGNGCPNICGWGNNELEYYTVKDTANVKVENGVLKITALKKAINNFGYSSARILSKNKAQFKYGKIEFRAKLPITKGTWPALWMLGSNIDSINWPASGEIDIMEHKGNDLNNIYGTLHYPGRSGGNADGKTLKINNVSKFHKYALQWDENELIFFVDGKSFHNLKNDKHLPFNQNFFIIINMAIGGYFAGAVDPNLTRETMEVDYVRVYQ